MQLHLVAQAAETWRAICRARPRRATRPSSTERQMLPERDRGDRERHGERDAAAVRKTPSSERRRISSTLLPVFGEPLRRRADLPLGLGAFGKRQEVFGMALAQRLELAALAPVSAGRSGACVSSSRYCVPSSPRSMAISDLATRFATPCMHCARAAPLSTATAQADSRLKAPAKTEGAAGACVRARPAARSSSRALRRAYDGGRGRSAGCTDATVRRRSSRLTGAEGIEPGRGEFDRQRQPIQFAADFGNVRRVGIPEFETGKLLAARSTNSSTAGKASASAAESPMPCGGVSSGGRR